MRRCSFHLRVRFAMLVRGQLNKCDQALVFAGPAPLAMVARARNCWIPGQHGKHPLELAFATAMMRNGLQYGGDQPVDCQDQ
ncbi:hypothetical protein DWB85_02220 [Seongchinamella sediminis]|uniref:Uncharacterized protein n=1 Tax=Seongchinamella sediminis TaxID=2283635 RepID=A0A3L7E3F5_9GAMM|nr:hypothetical protein DWB85_02220 [Seongchinamella sediminis]